MIREIKKQLTLVKRNLRYRLKWWGDIKISDIRAQKAEIILENCYKQKAILKKIDTLLRQLNELERKSKVVLVNAQVKENVKKGKFSMSKTVEFSPGITSKFRNNLVT